MSGVSFALADAVDQAFAIVRQLDNYRNEVSKSSVCNSYAVIINDAGAVVGKPLQCEHNKV